MKVQGSLAFEITACSAEEVTAEMPIGPAMLNPFGTVHAGAMIWFADVAATTLAFGSTDFQPGAQGFPLAINLVAQLVANQREGRLKAVSRFVKKGRTVSTVRTQVFGADERLLIDVTTSHVFSK
jgi:uncharacterized protein (TIGR00369 family)